MIALDFPARELIICRMKFLRCSYSIFAVIALLFLACAGKAPIAEREPVRDIRLPSIEIPSHDWHPYSFIKLDISHFPDSVSFLVPLGANSLDIRSATLIDDVEGWAEECEFSFEEYGVPLGSNIVIVEDISASMGDYVAFTDKLVWAFVSTLVGHGGEVALVRFGEYAETTVDWVLPDSFLNLTPEELPYPLDRGSDFAGALDQALKLTARRQSSRNAIVLFSDGDFVGEDLPVSLIERARWNNVSVNVFIYAEDLRGALAHLAEETGGIYMVQPETGFSAQLVSAIIAKSYRVRYYPKHTEEDGALHRVSLNFPGGGRYRGEFRAPGTISRDRIDIVAHNNPFVMPDELLRTTIVPFDSIGNAELLPSTARFLDDYISLFEKLPDTLRFSVRISGYACNLGPAGINIRLSRRRAEAVRDYLSPRIGGNFDMQIAWHGELYPLNSNSTDADRRANRRAEIKVELLDK